jgi:GT2 family glycosyltransferase
VGTVGARLYFADNTVQHDGILIGLEKTNNIRVTHHGFGSYYGYTTHTKNVIGNTAGFMMIRKKIFEKCNMFNENYIECFEDVELNLKCEILGYKNFISGKSVAYHYESQSRNNDKEKNKKTLSDFKERLEPFIKENLKKLKSIVIIN